MDLRYITPEAWQQFEEEHPAAAAFLNHESLKGEREALNRKLRRGEALTETELRRWRELDALEQATDPHSKKEPEQC